VAKKKKAAKKKAAKKKAAKKKPAAKKTKKPAAKKTKTPERATDDAAQEAAAMRAAEAREAHYRTLGEVNEYVLAPLINPMLMGGPDWPGARPAWRVIRRAGGLAIASDGLSTPVAGAPAGFGLEVIGECDEQVSFDDAASSWLFGIVYEVSQTCAGHGGIRPLLEELGLLSIEVDGEALPEDWRNEEGKAGALIGLGGPSLPATVPTPEGGDARLLTVTLLRPSELAFILEEPDTGRAEVARRLREAGVHHLSTLKRAAVV
jgi:hypothetical protein